MYKFLKISDRKGLITYFLVCIIVLSFVGILNQYSLSVPEDLKNSLGRTFYWTAMLFVDFDQYHRYCLALIKTLVKMFSFFRVQTVFKSMAKLNTLRCFVNMHRAWNSDKSFAVLTCFHCTLSHFNSATQ